MTNGELKETCCRFGEGRRLAGVVTEASGASARIAFVLITAGLTPKFGPFRLYAELARRLAHQGFLCLRFDLGGIGDSGPGEADIPLADRTRMEIRAALDFLCGRKELDGIVLGGLCSGAEDSLRYAELDPRVTGLMMMDPFAYKTFGWRWRNLFVRLARRALWMAGLLPTYAAARGASSLIDYAQMSRAESSGALRALVRRKTPMHFIYTGGMHESFNHKGQFKAMFRGIDFQGLATLDYFPLMRHTQVLEADRRMVIDSITRHLRPYPTKAAE